jgi:benzoyl-CoA reductase/2-hydroxyglutaryl-CoA dehydratase subunit BcrC/BadD/HgdB
VIEALGNLTAEALKRHNAGDENKEPIDALTEKYLNIACSCMTPNDKRIEML